MSSNVNVQRIETRDQLKAIRGQLRREAQKRNSWISFDLETRSPRGHDFEDWHDESRIVSVSFSPTDSLSYVIPLSHPHAPWADEWPKVAAWIFEVLPGAKLVGHNVKYDARWVLSRTGVDISPYISWDTMAGAFLMDENQGLGLKERAVQDLGVEPWDGVSLKDAEEADWLELAEYNGLDTAYTHALHLWQRDHLRQDRELARVMWRVLMPTIRSLVGIERNGLLLDPDEVERRREEAQKERDSLYHEFLSHVPDDLLEEYRDEKKPYSLNNSKFFRAYADRVWPILEVTNKEAPSWSASVLKRLAKKGHEDARVLLEYRQIDKQLSTYLNRWPKDVEPDGRIRATYKPTRVVTGRLSCERPNLHQVDRKLKPVFHAPPGWKMVQADYSQIELRFAAWLSGDENLTRAYTEGLDVHRMTAAAVTGKEVEDVTDEERYRAKAVNFGFLYGQLPPGFRNYARDQYEIDVSKEESEHMRDRFFRLYPGLLKYHERMRRFVRRHGYVKSPFGRVRRLPEIESSNQMKRWSAERQAINHPIQSGASDVLLMALNAVHDWADPQQCRVVGTVHDSIVFEIRENVLDSVLDTVGQLMVAPPTLAYYTVDIPVPLTVEFEVGARWGEAERTLEVST